jgi:hypothetical protein
MGRVEINGEVGPADDAGRVTAVSGTVAVVTAFWKTTDARTVY